MGGDAAARRRLAAWLVARRGDVERLLGDSLGGSLPPAGSAEAEALRRLRSFASSALLHGRIAEPPLDGLRIVPARAERLLSAWLEATARTAGPDAEAVREVLAPIAERFRVALCATATARRASGAPRRRRAVSAAIDRVADVFLAIDIETGQIEDANPAAGALLGTERDRLLGASALAHVPEASRDLWWTQLDALSEGAGERRFRTDLLDAAGHAVGVEASLTRFATRRRTLALVIARPAPVDFGDGSTSLTSGTPLARG